MKRSIISSIMVSAWTPAERRWPHGDPQALVRDILAQAAYHAAKAPVDGAPQASIWDMLRQWLGEVLRAMIERLAPFFHGARGTGAALGLVLLVVSGLALLLLITRLFMWVVKRFQSTGLTKMRQAVLLPERTASAWHALSLEAASQAHYGAATAALFMAALRLLDERRVLAFDAARTPNEYRRRVAGLLTAASSAFDRLAACFVRATYAQTAPERAVYDTAAKAYAAFSSEVPVS